jgi:hypothetical protein
VKKIAEEKVAQNVTIFWLLHHHQNNQNELPKVTQLVKNSPMFGLFYERISIVKVCCKFKHTL